MEWKEEVSPETLSGWEALLRSKFIGWRGLGYLYLRGKSSVSVKLNVSVFITAAVIFKVGVVGGCIKVGEKLLALWQEEGFL